MSQKVKTGLYSTLIVFKGDRALREFVKTIYSLSPHLGAEHQVAVENMASSVLVLKECYKYVSRKDLALADKLGAMNIYRGLRNSLSRDLKELKLYPAQLDSAERKALKGTEDYDDYLEEDKG